MIRICYESRKNYALYFNIQKAYTVPNSTKVFTYFIVYMFNYVFAIITTW